MQNLYFFTILPDIHFIYKSLITSVFLDVFCGVGKIKVLSEILKGKDCDLFFIISGAIFKNYQKFEINGQK